MATQETTPGSQTEESNALDLPSAYDIRDYVLQRPSQQTNSEAFSSEEACSIPCSSDVDPGKESGCCGSYLSKDRLKRRSSSSSSRVKMALSCVRLLRLHKL
ncbi:shieldin complex subunit 1 isoform X2 [Bos indicus]|uniref:Shieldin complex subunit 1 isoform X2 n=1 Tax=Bos indicus TaxID=9915 RepID=A0ABM4TB25_BOSIN|nr:shieldin complex subunit 1 isoform X2 [Bos taurus]